MEKPEWFEIVDALDGAPESDTPSGARAHSSRFARFAKRFAALGAAALIVSGGFAFGQSSSTSSSSDALASISTPAAAPSPAATLTAGASASPSVTGARPSITGAGPAGEAGND